MLALFIGFIALFISNSLLAIELHNNFYSIRALGMGGAYTAVATDKDAVWTNPAGIARIRKNRTRKKLHLISFPNVILGLNSGGQDFYKKFREISVDKDDENYMKEVEKIIDNNLGSDGQSPSPLWLSVSANPLIFYEWKKNIPIAAGFLVITLLILFLLNLIFIQMI